MFRIKMVFGACNWPITCLKWKKYSLLVNGLLNVCPLLSILPTTNHAWIQWIRKVKKSEKTKKVALSVYRHGSLINHSADQHWTRFSSSLKSLGVKKKKSKKYQNNFQMTRKWWYGRNLSITYVHKLLFWKMDESQHDKTNKMTLRPAKTKISLGIRPVWSVFADRMTKAWVLSYQLSASEDWSDWAHAQADLSLRWEHMPFCWFCHDAAQIFAYFSLTYFPLFVVLYKASKRRRGNMLLC